MKTIVLALSLLVSTLQAQTYDAASAKRIQAELSTNMGLESTQPRNLVLIDLPTGKPYRIDLEDAKREHARLTILAQAATLPQATVAPADQHLVVADTKEQIVTDVPQWFAGLAEKLPWLPKVMLWLSITLGMIAPTLTWLHGFVRQTPSDWDDKLLAKIEASPFLKYALIALKYLTGLNLVHPDAGTGPQVATGSEVSAAKTSTTPTFK